MVARSTIGIVVLASCGLQVSICQTIVVPLLPRFPSLMSVESSTATWLVIATLLAGAVAAPVAGRLGDMYGKRRLLLVLLGLVLLGSIAGALAPDFALLLAARVLQGASLGVIALGMSLIRDVLPSNRVGSGVGWMSSSMGVGGAIGPPLSGLVADTAGWRWLFAGSAVIALLQIVLVRWLVAESAVRSPGRFDPLGALGLGTALVCLMLGISKGSSWGFTSATVLGLVAAAVLVLLLWGWHQLHRPDPLVDLRISARPAVLRTNIVTMLVGFALFAVFLQSTQVLQAPPAVGYGFGLPMVTAGLALLPVGCAMMVFSSVSAVVSRVRGPRTTLGAGALLMAVGAGALAAHPRSLALVVGAATISSAGAALAYAALPLIIMRAVPETETAAANSLNTVMRQIGTSTCTAVVAAVGAALVVDVDGRSIPSGDAYTVVYAVASVIAACALLLVAWIPLPDDDRQPVPATDGS